MTVRTNIFLNSLSVHTQKKQVINLIINTHDVVKNQILTEGYKLNGAGEHFEEELVPKQIVKSEHLSLINYYEELNFLKIGVTKHWIDRIDDERFKMIREKFEDIMSKLA